MKEAWADFRWWPKSLLMSSGLCPWPEFGNSCPFEPPPTPSAASDASNLGILLKFRLSHHLPLLSNREKLAWEAEPCLQPALVHPEPSGQGLTFYCTRLTLLPFLPGIPSKPGALVAHQPKLWLYPSPWGARKSGLKPTPPSSTPTALGLGASLTRTPGSAYLSPSHFPSLPTQLAPIRTQLQSPASLVLGAVSFLPTRRPVSRGRCEFRSSLPTLFLLPYRTFTASPPCFHILESDKYIRLKNNGI